MDLDDKKYLLGIIINNLANSASTLTTTSIKLRELGDIETVAFLEDAGRECERLRCYYKRELGDLPADDRQS